MMMCDADRDKGSLFFDTVSVQVAAELFGVQKQSVKQAASLRCRWHTAEDLLYRPQRD